MHDERKTKEKTQHSTIDNEHVPNRYFQSPTEFVLSTFAYTHKIWNSYEKLCHDSCLSLPFFHQCHKKLFDCFFVIFENCVCAWTHRKNAHGPLCGVNNFTMRCNKRRPPNSAKSEIVWNCKIVCVIQPTHIFHRRRLSPNQKAQMSRVSIVVWQPARKATKVCLLVSTTNITSGWSLLMHES